MSGIQLKAFDPSGTPAGGNTLVGGLQLNSSSAAAFGPAGRISEAAFNRYVPVTAGSATSSVAGAISVVAFDLAGAAAAPVLAADRDILDIDDIHLQGSPYSRTDSKSVNVFLSDGSSTAFAGGIVLGASFGLPPTPPPLPFTSSTGDQGLLPGSITVSATADGDQSQPTALVVLAPGAQGTLTIPVRFRSRNFSASTAATRYLRVSGGLLAIRNFRIGNFRGRDSVLPRSNRGGESELTLQADVSISASHIRRQRRRDPSAVQRDH